MNGDKEPPVWRLHQWRSELAQAADDPVLAMVPPLGDVRVQLGQEFLIRSDGYTIAEVNAFLASPRMRNRASGTREKYGRGIGVWLGYLDAVGRRWSEASPQDVEGFKFWRPNRSRATSPGPLARIAGFSDVRRHVGA
jgi:hypothetical protein